MSKIKNGGLDQYGAEPYKQQQFGTGGVEWVNNHLIMMDSKPSHQIALLNYPACQPRW